MDEKNDQELLSECLKRVEARLGWGSPVNWSTQDFETLSEEILKTTGTHLSMATLKRLWGRIKYDSKPTATTLNVLAQYLGFADWRSFARECQGDKTERKSQFKMPGVPGRKVVWSVPVLIVIAAFLVFNYLLANEPVDPSVFEFETTQMVPEGVPNSVIFHYDASEAPEEARVMVQQSWDKEKSKEVNRSETVHTSVYYYPGFFRAKLVVDDQIVREEDVFIKTNGWISMIEQNPVPVYLDQRAFSGQLKLTESDVLERNIPLQPTAPWTSHMNVWDFEGLSSDNFTLETNIKNTYGKGASICQYSEIHLLFKGGAMMTPFSVKGCVSELGFRDSEGPKDPSGLGVDFTDWVNVKINFSGKKGKIFVNGHFVTDLTYGYESKPLIGLRYRFQGAGAVDYVRLSNNSGELIYSEDFEQ